MPLSNSVIRCYTPPTCTLEVLAQSSPLSRWMGKTVLKQLSFELRFDDPRLPEDRRVPIRGDRDQLEALCDAVTTYVQQFLQQSPESFWVTFSGPQESSNVLDEPEELKDLPSSSLSAKTLKSLTSQVTGTEIHLEPSSYLNHNLFLGSLANQVSGRVIQLSLLQLFDLASALDEYSADVMVLPTINSRSSSLIPTWAPVAAVLVLALGLTPVTWQYANNIRQKQQRTAKTVAPTEAKIALETSPSLNFPTPQSGLIPPDNFQSSLPPLGSAPGLPTSSLPPKPLISPSSNFSTKSQISSPNSSLPTTTQSPNSNFSTTPLLSPKDPLTLPQTKTPTLPTNARSTALTKIPGQEIAIQPNLGQNPARPIPQTGNALPERQSLPSSPQNDDSLGKLSAANKPSSDLSSSTTSPRTTENNPFIDRLGDGRKVPTPQNVATGTLFDTPQIAEAREYISKRWQPPARLRQTLEYSLLLSVDGKIERIFPLNKAAREFVDSAGMPNIGKPFVSANKTGQNLRIRVVLSPDGKVLTFPESE
jgi:hypothetical protein